MPAKRKDATATAITELYAAGFTLAQIAIAFSITRQAVYKMLKRRGIRLRTIEPLPFIEWRGRRYTLRDNGYYAATEGDREYLHRAVWKLHFGDIPEGFEVHHVDEDKTHNHPSNFLLLTSSDHGKLHGFAGCTSRKQRSEQW